MGFYINLWLTNNRVSDIINTVKRGTQERRTKMTVKDLHKILEDMINNGLGDLEIVNANNGENGDKVADADVTMDDKFGIWWR